MIRAFRFPFHSFNRFVIAALLCFASAQVTKGQFYAGYQMNFGKSRIQYTEFFWNYYRQTRYDVYFYQGGQELGEFVNKSVAMELDDIER